MVDSATFYGSAPGPSSLRFSDRNVEDIFTADTSDDEPDDSEPSEAQALLRDIHHHSESDSDDENFLPSTASDEETGLSDSSDCSDRPRSTRDVRIQRTGGNKRTKTTSTRKLKKRARQFLWQKRSIPDVDTSWKASLPDPPPEILTPFQYFRQFFDREMFEHLAEQTNLYSVQKSGKSTNTDADEMEQFVGIFLMTGLIPFPQYHFYWNEKLQFTPVSQTMSKNRFKQLRRYFHAADNSKILPKGDPGFDSLFKLRPFLDALQEKCLTVAPEEAQSVDEQMAPFKGRSSLRQYIKNKPHKWGFKIFVRAGISGIVYQFAVYTGADTLKKNQDHQLGFGGNVVMALCDGLPNASNFKVTFDNWFCSIELIEALKRRGIFSCGTIRANRMRNCALESEKDLRKRGRGSFDYKVENSENVVVVRWLDNKAVHLASSYAGVEPEDQVKRWSASEKKHILVARPAIVKTYNETMGGVDLADQLIEYYRIPTRFSKWYIKLFVHFLNLIAVNSWLVYRRHAQQLQLSKQMTLFEFILDVSDALRRSGKTDTRKRGRPASSPGEPSKKTGRPANPRPSIDTRYDQIGHWPEFQNQKQRCKNCISSYTKWSCRKCNVRLCLSNNKNCFVDFHKK